MKHVPTSCLDMAIEAMGDRLDLSRAKNADATDALSWADVKALTPDSARDGGRVTAPPARIRAALIRKEDGHEAFWMGRSLCRFMGIDVDVAVLCDAAGNIILEAEDNLFDNWLVSGVGESPLI